MQPQAAPLAKSAVLAAAVEPAQPPRSPLADPRLLDELRLRHAAKHHQPEDVGQTFTNGRPLGDDDVAGADVTAHLAEVHGRLKKDFRAMCQRIKVVLGVYIAGRQGWM